MSSMIGRSVARYRIVEKLGAGGMGVVYKAEDRGLRRLVALKFLAPHLTSDPDATGRFVAEARAASSIDHPNICTVHEIGETEEGQLFICMALCTGESLREKLRAGPLAVPEALRVCIEVARGLTRAHALGVVHRDIKPANIMLTNGNQVKIVDFGLAKLSGQTAPTRAGIAMGTAGYMSPEQARGDAVDARTDIWSLAVVLFELLTGALPFKGANAQALVHAILNAEPASAIHLRSDIPWELERLFDKALRKNPRARHASMQELLGDLEEVARVVEGGLVRRRIRRLRVPRRTRRTLWIALPVSGILAACLGLALWRPLAAREARPTIAVLAFTTNDGSLEWFTASLRDVIVADLARLRRLRVKPVSRAMIEGRRLPQFARGLGADYILDGSVLHAGTTARVTAFLVDGRTDEQLWADRYVKDLSDVMGVQGDITRAVVNSIRVEVSPEEKAVLETAGPVNPAASEAYLRAIFLEKRMSVEGGRRAVELLGAAVAADPRQALPLAALAGAWAALGSAEMGAVAPGEAARQAEEAAQRALTLSPLLGEPHRVLGEVRRDFQWDFGGAEQEFLLALERDPRDAQTLAQVALLRIAQGKYAEAWRNVREARNNDPLSLPCAAAAAFVSACQGRWEDSSAELARALDFDASFSMGFAERGRMSLLRGRPQEAAEALARAAVLMDGFNPILTARLAFARAQSGDVDAARALLDELTSRAATEYVPPAAFALVHAGLGDNRSAFLWLRKALDEKAPQLIYLRVNPEWAGLRNDARFTKLLEELPRQR